MRAGVVMFVIGATGAPAAAGVGPAAELGFASGATSEDVGGESALFAHADLGLQYGRVAALFHLEAMDVATADATLDSNELSMRGKGAAVRVELLQSRRWYGHLTAGYTWRTLEGDGETQRGCMVFGGCDAGFYREVPRYTDGATWMSVSFGVRGPTRIWPAIGVELGVGPLTIDRSGDAPDTQGHVVWIGLDLALGSD